MAGEADRQRPESAGGQVPAWPPAAWQMPSLPQERFVSQGAWRALPRSLVGQGRGELMCAGRGAGRVTQPLHGWQLEAVLCVCHPEGGWTSSLWEIKWKTN